MAHAGHAARDDDGGPRATLWDVHPITKVEVKSHGQWVKLDNYPLSRRRLLSCRSHLKAALSEGASSRLTIDRAADSGRASQLRVTM